ncbi:hypothetical protein MARINON1_20390 [Marinobacter salarius]|nr:hypothetical protein MBHK15_80137 [Marinobacter salarius]VXB06352.1 hypothetical protein MARINON1_20390 [Marinobacter salarius]
MPKQWRTEAFGKVINFSPEWYLYLFKSPKFPTIEVILV